MNLRKGEHSETGSNLCDYCGHHFIHDNPTVDICRACYYQGRDKAAGPMREALEAFGREHKVEIEHTGGGCFWIAAYLENGQRVCFTAAGDGVLPETAAGPWLCGHYFQIDDEDLPIKSLDNARLRDAVEFLRSCVQRTEVGQRVRFRRAVERFPHALVEVGETGTVCTVVEGEFIAVQLDRTHHGLEEWQNELHFAASMDGYHEFFGACEEVR